MPKIATSLKSRYMGIFRSTKHNFFESRIQELSNGVLGQQQLAFHHLSTVATRQPPIVKNRRLMVLPGFLPFFWKRWWIQNILLSRYFGSWAHHVCICSNFLACQPFQRSFLQPQYRNLPHGEVFSSSLLDRISAMKFTTCHNDIRRLTSLH